MCGVDAVGTGLLIMGTVLSQAMQEEFRGFSYSADFV